MSRKSSKRVSFSPDISEKPKRFLKPETATKAAGNRKRVGERSIFRLASIVRFSTVGLLRQVGSTIKRAATCFVSAPRASPKARPISRSRPSISPQDFHRTEDIQDCIKFLNSSCSLERTNSVSPVSVGPAET